MNDKLSPQQCEAILKALDEAIEQGPWDQSNFLKALGQNLQKSETILTTKLKLLMPFRLR